MRIIADLQLHSKYSRATSKFMDLEHLAEGARRKGVNLLGTGDFTHPKWFEQIKQKLEQLGNSGIFAYEGMNWMLTSEVSTIYEQDGKVRKIHHLFYAPSIEVVEQIIDRLAKRGNLESDGRPVFSGLTSPEFVEMMMEISKDIIVMPSHAWTPWFGCYGSKSGFDSIKECYQDQLKHIFALETGLSSDPPMNWRLSELDGITLMSNSDAHSPHPWRLGREANVFEMKKLSYKEIYDTVKKGDPKRFLFTIEVDPNYGKYHFTGHRNCGVMIHPKEAIKLKNSCPKCRRKLTVGVLQRVEELADRPEGYQPKKTIPFRPLLPLYEIISFVTGVNQLYNKRVIEQQNRLIERFGSEFEVLLKAPIEQLKEEIDERVAEAIVKVREGRIRFQPGYDGVYGEPVFGNKPVIKRSYGGQRSLKDF